MNTQKIEETRSKFILDCEEKAWRLECGAAFDQVRVDKLKAEQKKAMDNREALQQKIKDAEPKDKTRQAREEYKAVRQELEPQIADATEYLQQAEATICTINERIFDSKADAKNMREKAEFAKSFGWKEENPEAKGEVSQTIGKMSKKSRLKNK